MQLPIIITDIIIRQQVIRTFDAVVTQASKIAEAATWEQQRQVSKEIRAGFTTTLENHGVSGFGFAQCTNSRQRTHGCQPRSR